MWYGPVYLVYKRLHQQKRSPRRMQGHCIRTQQIRPERYVCPARPVGAYPQLLDPGTSGYVGRNLTLILCVRCTLMVNSIFQPARRPLANVLKSNSLGDYRYTECLPDPFQDSPIQRMSLYRNHHYKQADQGSIVPVTNHPQHTPYLNKPDHGKKFAKFFNN